MAKLTGARSVPKLASVARALMRSELIAHKYGYMSVYIPRELSSMVVVCTPLKHSCTGRSRMTRRQAYGLLHYLISLHSLELFTDASPLFESILM